jgi:transcriptional regulator with XRE-family HTH domain
MPNKPDIASFLRSRRQSIPNLTIGKLSQLTGLSKAILSRYETGQRRPSPSALMKLAPYLQVNYRYLLYLAEYLDEDWRDQTEIQEAQRVFYLTPEEEELILLMRQIGNKSVRKVVRTLLTNLINCLE